MGQIHHPWSVLAFTAAATLLMLALFVGPSRAQAVPGGWTSLGEVQLENNACVDCPATFPTPARQRRFGLGTDSPYPVALAGKVVVTCADGTSYQTLLRPSRRGGLFQVIGNTCVNLDSKEVALTLTSVSVSPEDAARVVTLTVYGRLQ